MLACFRKRLFCVAAFLLASAPARLHAQAFTDVTSEVGIDCTHLNDKSSPLHQSSEMRQSGGAAARDFDGDGWVDLVVTRLDADPILYRNIPDPRTPGSRRFVDVSAKLGIARAPATNGAAWGDIDNDGRPDLFFTSFAERYYLFMNRGENGFVEEAAQRGTDLFLPADNGVAHSGTSISFGDYDRDGYLDVATGEWSFDVVRKTSDRLKTPMRRFQLMRNLGQDKPGHFEMRTDLAGVNTFPMDYSVSFTPRFTDLDQDGWVDLAVTSDLGTSRLYWNNHDGTFTDGTSGAAVGTDQSGMGSTIGDFDRDGDLDWFVSSIWRGMGQNGNRLYLNRMIRPRNQPGTPRSFADATDLGVRESWWAWGASFLDYDNDGWLDLAVTNGLFHEQIPNFVNDPMCFFHNNAGETGKPTFTEKAADLGLSDTGSGKGLLTLDYDNDGDQDLFIVNNFARPVLYRNNVGQANHWIKLRLIGTRSNRDAAGAFIRLVDEQLGGAARPLVFEITASSNYLAQSEPTAFFGLGSSFSGTIDTITIRWPNGDEQTIKDVPIDRFLQITEGSGELASMAAGPHP